MNNMSKSIRLTASMLIISLLLPLALAGSALAEEYKYSHAEYLDIVDLFFSVD